MRGDVRELYKAALTQFQNPFDSPLDFSVHLFTNIGNGYEWTEDGRLESWSQRKPNKRSNESDDLLKQKATKLKQDFVLENIESILDSGPVASYFRQGYTRFKPYLTRGIRWRLPQCNAFYFPKTIQPQWAETLLTFVDWWIMCLRYTYGVDNQGKIGVWWPADVLEAYEPLCDLKKRLDEKVHGPPCPEKERVAKEIIDKILAKRKAYGT